MTGEAYGAIAAWTVAALIVLCGGVGFGVYWRRRSIVIKASPALAALVHLNATSAPHLGGPPVVRYAFRDSVNSPQTGAVLHVDHIRAVSNGGRTVPENLQTLCQDCNLGKSNRF